MRKIIAFVCVCVVAANSIAQNFYADSTKQLNEVTVSSNRLENFTTGSKIEQTDSVLMVAYKHQSLTDLLGSQSQLFIKSTGPGSLATSSFRGAGAEHTAVLWNGFNIQSPMNGQIDFSLIQVDGIDEIKVQYGSSGALFGSGAVGGIIHIENKPNFNSGFHASINAQTGSFSNYKQGVNLNFGTPKYYTSFALFNQTSTNDFNYQNTYLQGSPEMKQTNASYNQQGVLNNHYFQLTSKQNLNVRIWYQTSLRQIPPTMSNPNTKATQKDETLRISSEWSLQQKSAVYFIRSAWFDEKLIYQDSLSSLLSHSHSQTNITEAESKITVSKNQLLNIGINHTFSSATVESYNGNFNQNRTSFFASYKIHNSKKTIQTCLSLREELFAGNALPIMPSAGFEWQLNNRIKLFGNVSRSYRVPTLNELFWNDAFAKGNKNLLPESGWAEEISLNINHQISLLKIDFTSTVFNRIMDNYIQWLPLDNYYTPQNIKQVWSRGLEGNLKLILPIGKCNFIYSGRVNYVLSTNEQSSIINDATLHKQLRYVPKLNYLNQVIITYKTFFISFSQTYTGIRFTENDESNYLLYYLLENGSVGNEFKLNKFSFLFQAQVKNIGNESYQVIQNMPMPRRNFLLSLTIKI